MDESLNGGWAQFSGFNAAYMADLYEQFSEDPASVDPGMRAFFERWGPPPTDESTVAVPAEPAPGYEPAKLCAVRALSSAIRTFGYRAARLDPLGSTPPGDLELLPETHGLSDQDLAVLPPLGAGGPATDRMVTALSAVSALREIYQGTSGYEFEHVSNGEERLWLRNAVESCRYCPPQDSIDERKLLERLTQVEGLEKFLHTSFPAQTRFSLEGLDMMVPMLDELVGAAAEAGTGSTILGMAHRGRINVLAHILGKPYEDVVREFLGSFQRPSVSASGSSDEGWTGDVKYHLGARRAVKGGEQVEMMVALAPNPSHLEVIDPVVKGMTRADSETRDKPGPSTLDERVALGVIIHGDASFVGEGVVAETMNLSMLPGYHTGGVVHIIANNQLGFTTSAREGRSTLFASDLAKGFEIPVIHVNADDVESCISAVRLAHAFVLEFHKDVLIDLIGYRRWGHNEGDEPSFTQPEMYSVISQHPTVRQIWADRLIRRGVVQSGDPENMLRSVMEQLQGIRRTLAKEQSESNDGSNPAGREAGGVRGGLGNAGVALEIRTAVAAAELTQLNEQILSLPEGFSIHPKLEPLYSRRRAAFPSQEGEEPRYRIDWAHAEELAFASILAEGTPIRLTGQDTRRGTFSQRHLVLHDPRTGATYTPLQSIPSAKVSFDVWDSPLSELAPLGFEFGYSVQAPESLVLWEAQYGDFINMGQVMLDAFITSSRSKWDERSAMVLLLPHGYEGQGPDHSSARLERFLQMSTEDNLRVAYCTTAAQYFHILRRQAKLLARDPRPLVLLTPKSLLRHPLAASPLAELSEGRFLPVIDDADAAKDPAAVQRLVLCSGHIYVDLAGGRANLQPETAAQVAVVRVEELYPFPADEVERVINDFPNLREVVWAQEEPRNQGAWTFVAPRIRDLLGDRLPLTYVGRPRRASTAEGSHEWHVREQPRLVEAALRLEAASRPQP